MSCPYGSGLGWLCWRGVWGISQGPPHFLAHLASLFARWALWLELQVGVEVHQQGWIVALPEARAKEPSERTRSEEHTSELQSRPHLLCRLLLEKKKTAR